ncbi:AzlD family protein [Sinorhizobium sp. BG8]|uniref:AzlD family protein n=1 Tax=Sinorhizobium sp. BG8 TaxID=2613773 RepID=UPI00193D667E|nr:AzlD family protein [Sinorhizobium sp. BG8]QRM55972.1 AzlD family protein [Sinorhizobium sp. BG8]
MEQFFHTQTLVIILFGAIATYLTRVGGYVLVTRLKRIPPRLEAALNAVPAAVLTTLVAPAAVTGGVEVALAVLAALAIGMRFSVMPMLAGGWIVVMGLRYLIGL